MNSKEMVFQYNFLPAAIIYHTFLNIVYFCVTIYFKFILLSIVEEKDLTCAS